MAKEEFDNELDQSKYRSKDRKDKEQRGKDRERSKRVDDDAAKEREESKDLEKEREKHRDIDRSKDSKAREKDYDRDIYREKDRGREREKDKKDGGKVKERERERDKGRLRDREKEERDKANEKDREKEREKHKEREKDRESEKDRDRERGREKIREKDGMEDREKGRERTREKEWEVDRDTAKERPRLRERMNKKSSEEDGDRGQEDTLKLSHDHKRDKDVVKSSKVSFQGEDQRHTEDSLGVGHIATSELEERISKMKEERLKKKPEGASEILSWINKSRKIEERKNAEKEKVMQLSKVFEEQDNIGQQEIEDEEVGEKNRVALAGVKVLHGLDKVMEGGSVVLTLKDQSILANGDINEDVDMLENVEIGEQKRRDEAYKASTKKTGNFDDRFNDGISSEKKMLPQYDDPVGEEGITLDGKGRFSAEAEKKLEELRRKLQGGSTNIQYEDLHSSAKISSDYYTSEEMLQFKKPKKKKSLRKKDKLNIDALEEQAVAEGLGVGDLGVRNDGRRRAIRDEKERSEAEMRNTAFQSAYAKADEASKSLRLEQTLPAILEEDDSTTFADDDEDLYKSLQRARKVALKKQEVAPSVSHAVALLAKSTASLQSEGDQVIANGESQDSKIVITEMEEFVYGLHFDEDTRKPESEDVFMGEDEAPNISHQEREDDSGGWMEAAKDLNMDEIPLDKDEEEIIPDATIHEGAVGKGLSGALKLLKDRGTLKETVEWGGRNMDKKKSKLVGIVDTDADAGSSKERFKDINIERTDEFGRVLTPKEAFRLISHKFHGKGPGKMKQEKRMKQYYEELKMKQMKNSDTPSLSVERMIGAQTQLKTPYLVLSGNVKPGQTSDQRSGFATIEKDLPGGLTPMLGDRKVEHFLGIKRKSEPGNSNGPKRNKH